jgi:hypothetical protein
VSRKAQLVTTILAGLRDAPLFTDADRAALAPTKAVTRPSGRVDQQIIGIPNQVKQRRTAWHRQDS